MAFVSYVSFGVLTCSCSSFPASLPLFLSLAYSLVHSFAFSFCSFLAVSISLDALRYPFYSCLPFVHYLSHYYIFPSLLKNTHVTSNNQFLVCYTHYRDDENGAFGSFKLDGLSDFTYTWLCRRSASRPARTLLSLVLSSAQQGYLYKLRKIGVLRAIRARTSHTNSPPYKATRGPTVSVALFTLLGRERLLRS